MSFKLKQLRKLFLEYKVNGYILPSWDEFQNETVSSFKNRLRFITGFTGSNGIAIILEEKALFFTDGRYLLQAQKELDIDIFRIFDLKELDTFICGDSKEFILGYDPLLFTSKQLGYFHSLKLVSIAQNLVDIIWHDKPNKLDSKIFLYPEKHSNTNCQQRLEQCRNVLKQNFAESALITDSATICWLLNIRADDLEFSPLLLCYLILSFNEVCLFSNSINLEINISEYFSSNNVKYIHISNINESLSNLTGKIIIDTDTCPIAFINSIKQAHVISKNNIFAILKSCKNETELSYFKDRHLEDSVVLCELLAWIEYIVNNGGVLTEYQVANELTSLRKQNQNYICDSFATICGYQENGAIIHYRPSNQESKLIQKHGLLLIDSGANYYGATTDVTRTICLAQSTIEQQKEYTLVLKGHIKLLKTIFPKGTTGCQLDVLARMFLWENGFNYPHGTGHGVGSCLNVHEGPQSINAINNVVLQKGMVLSNEPGYYKPKKYGIRIENLMYITNHHSFNDFLCFHNLTFVPYCKNLIASKLLTNEEETYLEDYSKELLDKVAPKLSKNAKEWLSKELF